MPNFFDVSRLILFTAHSLIISLVFISLILLLLHPRHRLVNVEFAFMASFNISALTSPISLPNHSYHHPLSLLFASSITSSNSNSKKLLLNWFSTYYTSTLFLFFQYCCLWMIIITISCQLINRSYFSDPD